MEASTGTSHRWISHFSFLPDLRLKLFTSQVRFPFSQDSTSKNFKDKFPNHHLILSFSPELWKKRPKISQEWDDEGLSTNSHGIQTWICFQTGKLGENPRKETGWKGDSWEKQHFGHINPTVP